MNRRTLKKHCIRAKATLIKDHGYSDEDFTLAEGGECFAPRGMERRFALHGFLEPGPLRGTPIVWGRPHGCGNDQDGAFPSEKLRDILFWENVSDDEFRRMGGTS